MFPLGRNWIFSSWMATQRWKRRSHIFCDNLLFLFLVRNNNQDQTRRSFFSSCLLVFHFFDPPCGVGPLSVFVKKVYSLFLLFCFASSFSFNTKTRDQHIFWLIPETERRRHERPTLCDVSVCVWLLQCCCSYRSIAFKRGKKREMMEGRNFSFPHFYTLVRLVMMMAISCTCHGKERQVGQLFHPLSKQMPTFLLTDIWWWPCDDPGLR